MKKIIKTLLLSAVILGTAIGCQETGSSTQTSNNTSSNDTSSISESRTSSSPFESSTTSSISSSSTSSSSSSSVAPTLTGITLDTTNVKKYYRYGQTLDLTGLVVTANYSNNTTETVTDYTTSVAVGTELKENTKIVVTYKNFTDEFTVEVDYGCLGLNHDIIEGKRYLKQERRCFRFI